MRMERFSLYLLNDFRKKEEELRKSLFQFIQQTCRMNHMELDFGSTPLRLDDFTIHKVKWDLSANVLYVVATDTLSDDEKFLPITSSDACFSVKFSTQDLLTLAEHVVFVLSA